jgi:hypothetical protein
MEHIEIHGGGSPRISTVNPRADPRANRDGFTMEHIEIHGE